MTDADNYRQHAEKIRRLVAGVRGHAATAALLLADEYDARADHLDGRPAAAAYIGNVERIGELVAHERETLDALAIREADLQAQLVRVRQQRVVAEARVDAILQTARILDVPEPPRRSVPPPSFREAATLDPDAATH